MMPAGVKVIVIWDGANPSPDPPDLCLPPGRVLTLPPGSLEGYKSPDPVHGDRLLDDLVDWASAGPTVVVPWRGLPGRTVRQLVMNARILGREQVLVLPPAPSPVAALSVGWRLALLADQEQMSVREAEARAVLLTEETQVAVLLPRPNRAPIIDLGPAELVRALRRGKKVAHLQPRRPLAAWDPDEPMLASANAANAGNGGPETAAHLIGPRLIFVSGGVDVEPFDLGLLPDDIVVELLPGSLDSEAWGQRSYAEVVASPRGVYHLLPSATGSRLCPGCELLTLTSQPTCDRCSLSY